MKGVVDEVLVQRLHTPLALMLLTYRVAKITGVKWPLLILVSEHVTITRESIAEYAISYAEMPKDCSVSSISNRRALASMQW